MSIWREYFKTDVPVQVYISRDDYGNPSYEPVRNVKCRVEFRRANVVNSAGEMVTSEIRLLAAEEIPAGSLVAIQGVEWAVLSCGSADGLDGAVDHYEMRA